MDVGAYRADGAGEVELAQEGVAVRVVGVAVGDDLREAKQAALLVRLPDAGGWLGLLLEVEFAAVEAVGDDTVEVGVEREGGDFPFRLGEEDAHGRRGDQRAE